MIKIYAFLLQSIQLSFTCESYTTDKLTKVASASYETRGGVTGYLVN